MDEVPQAPEDSLLVRLGFATVFVPACIYDLRLGIRIAGVFMAGLSLYEAMLGRVPVIGIFNQTTGYVKGPLATVLIACGLLFGSFLIFAPDTLLWLLQ